MHDFPLPFKFKLQNPNLSPVQKKKKRGKKYGAITLDVRFDYTREEKNNYGKMRNQKKEKEKKNGILIINIESGAINVIFFFQLALDCSTS